MALFLWVFPPGSSACFSSEESPDQIDLETILGKVKEYCHRLEAGAYDFVCREEISEKIDFSHEEAFFKKHNYEYIYDYQLIKKGYITKESRILLEKNGRKVHEENAPLGTRVFRHTLVLLRTVDLFNEFGNSVNDYKIIGEEILYGENAIVIETVPKASYEQRFLSGVEPSYLFGKIWVNKKDWSILKIIWNPKVIKDFENIIKLAEKFKAEPRITILSEYMFEKNGIRFPSRLFVEEAYINQKGKKFIRSKTDIIYKDYKFFTVETDIKY